MQPTPVLEVLTYRLTPSLTAQDYLAIVRQTAPAIARNPGLISRSLACDDTGTWTEVSRWSSQAQADAAGQVVMTDPDVAPLMAAIDMASLTMRFVPILWQNPD